MGPLLSLASIPSPSFNTIDIWPRPFTLYGIMIGLGIIAATLLARPRLAARRVHPDTAVELLMWAVPGGVIGARLYHVITDGVSPANWIKIWEGGLGIPGAIAGGGIATLLFLRLRDLPRARILDAVIPGVPLAQAVGRWGNWWNQELYGRPTDLPWGLEIDADHRIAGYLDVETFHPTFLYESIWNLGIVGVLLLIDRRRVLRPGKLIWVYTGLYAVGRLWIESLRIDPATEIGGIRINIWMMGLVLIGSLFLLRNARADGTDAANNDRDDVDVDADSARADDDAEDRVDTDVEGDEEE